MSAESLMTSLLLLWAAFWCQAAVVMTTKDGFSDTTQQPPSLSTTVNSKDKFSCFEDHPSLQHGYFEAAEGVGHVIIPHCKAGFRLVGGDLICNETKQRFIGKEPRCEDIDECSFMVEDDDDDDSIRSSALSEDDDEVDDGYDFRNCHHDAKCINSLGSYKCVCQDGFQGNGFICNSNSKTEERCNVPEPPSFGVIYPIDPLNVRILCHPDYSIHGRSIIKCERGRWDPSPKCIPGWKSCGDPGVPKNGYQKGNRYHEGAAVRFYCRQGYQIQGSRLRMCLEPDLHWTGTQPHCIEIIKEKIQDGGEVPTNPKILHREKRI